MQIQTCIKRDREQSNENETRNICNDPVIHIVKPNLAISLRYGHKLNDRRSVCVGLMPSRCWRKAVRLVATVHS